MSVFLGNETIDMESTTTSTNYSPIIIGSGGLIAEELAQKWDEIIKAYNDYWSSKSTQSTRKVQRIKRKR